MQEWTPEQLKSELDAGKTVFLKIWQRGCGPCKLSESATNRIQADEKYENIIFVKICTDDHPEILETTGAETLPVFFLFAQQKMLGKYTGFKGQKPLEEFIDTKIQL